MKKQCNNEENTLCFLKKWGGGTGMKMKRLAALFLAAAMSISTAATALPVYAEDAPQPSSLTEEADAGTQADGGGRHGSLSERHSLPATRSSILCDEDGRLGQQSDEHNEAGLHIDIVFQPTKV